MGDYLELEPIDIKLRPPMPPGHGEQVRQARWTYNFACSILIIGVVVTITAMILGKNVGYVFAGVSLDAVAGFILKFHRETSIKLEAIRREETIHELLKQLPPEAKQQAIVDLVKALGNDLAKPPDRT